MMEEVIGVEFHRKIIKNNSLPIKNQSKQFKYMNEIPKEFQIDSVICDRYLVDGQLKKWIGNTSEVYSTIQTANSDGKTGPTLLGTIPDMETKSAIEALNSAEKAYDKGKGLWPTMRVSERLKCMKTFVKKMKINKNIIKMPKSKRFKCERMNNVSVIPPVSLRDKDELALYNITVPMTQRITIRTSNN